MKKLLIMLAAVGMVFTACEGGGVEEENGQKEFTSSIKLSQSEIEVDCEDGEYSIKVTSPYSWQAASYFDWIEVETEAGTGGTETLQFSVEPNDGLQERRGVIVINNRWLEGMYSELKIVQKGNSIILDCPEKFYISSKGEEKLVEIEANFEYEASIDADWLSYEVVDNGVKVAAMASNGSENRTAILTITSDKYGISKVVEIIQSSFVPELVSSDKNLDFAVIGGEKFVAVTTNVDYEISSDAEWLTCTKDSEGVTVTVTASDSIKERVAKVLLSNAEYGISQSIEVTQAPFEPMITIEPESLNFAVDGGETELHIRANFEFEISLYAGWLSCKEGEDGVYTITAEESFSTKERTAKIIVANDKYEVSEVINVTQEPFVAEVSISQNSLYFNDKGGAKIISVETNFEYEVSSSDSWLTCRKLDGGIEVTAKSLTKDGERSARVILSNDKYGIKEYIDVTQANSGKLPANEIHYTTLNGEMVTLCEFASEYAEFKDENWPIGYDEPIVDIYGKETYTISTSSATRSASNNQQINRARARILSATTNSVATRGSYTVSTEPIDIFGANIVSHTYEGGMGRIVFDGPVTKVGNFAFMANYNPDLGLEDEYIGTCKQLVSVSLPEGVKYIGNMAFYECINLQDISIPSTVTGIGLYAFTETCSLTSISFPEKLESIGVGAFCASGISSITIPNSVTHLGEEAFYYCTNLRSISGKYASSDHYCLVKDGVLTTFALAAGLTTYTIPSNVTTIGTSAFEECGDLTKVTMSNNVVRIDDFAFSFCQNLAEVTLSNSLEFIGDDAFSGCATLKRLELPESVATIEDYTFAGCSSLEYVNIPKSVTSIGRAIFYEIGLVGELVIDNAIIETDLSGYYYSPSKSWDHWLGGSCFAKITIGKNVTKIGKYAFYQYDSLQSFDTGNSVVSLGRDSLSGCSALTEVKLGNSLTIIDDYAFNDCLSLLSLTIPESVTTIGYEGIHNCPSLEALYFKSNTPPTLESYALDTYSDKVVYYVPSSAVSTYKSKWSRYSSFIVGYDF